MRATAAAQGRSRVLAPSDVAASPPARTALDPGPIRVGGRVAAQQGRELTLVDALGGLSVLLDEDRRLAPGALVVVDGRWDRQRLVDAVVVSERALPEPVRGGEHARLAWDGVGPRLAARSQALAVVRDHFARAGFVEVETPTRLRAPALEPNVDALPVGPGWLATSPELHMKRLLVGGLPRIYQIAKVFRADEAGTWHEPEFTLLEWYRSFSDYDAVIEDTEAIVSAVVRALRGGATLPGPEGREIDVTPPFERLPVREAFRRYASVPDAAALAAADPARYFELLVDRVEPALKRHDRPVLLVEYPLSEAALSRPVPHDPTVAERFELYVGGVELSNGYGELVDAAEQRRRFERERERRAAAGLPLYPCDDRFLAALEEGMPASAGNALGLDRLLALATGAPGIAAVLAFPEACR